MVPESLSVAVLPFVTDTGEPGEVALASVMTDGVILALGRVQWLDVLATDLPTYAGATMWKSNTASHRASYVLRGGVRSIGGRVQVTVRLLERATARHIWGDAFDGAPGDARALQQRVVEVTAGTVPVCLRNAESACVMPRQSVLRKRRNVIEAIMT
jgi:adenylate cyclase